MLCVYTSVFSCGMFCQCWGVGTLCTVCNYYFLFYLEQKSYIYTYVLKKETVPVTLCPVSVTEHLLIH